MPDGLQAFLTVVGSLAASLAVVWTALGKYRQGVESAKKLAEERTDALTRDQEALEARLRQEQLAAEMSQSELENKFRNEMREDMSRVRAEARDLAAQLRLSEEENRKLRMRVFDLEMELARLRASIGLQANISHRLDIQDQTANTIGVQLSESLARLGDHVAAQQQRVQATHDVGVETRDIAQHIDAKVPDPDTKGKTP